MRFIADKMLGRLAKWLRILGYDTLYFNTQNPRDMCKIAREEGRLILTRNTKLKGRKNLLFIKGDDLGEQIEEVVKGLNLKISPMFNRCLICNQGLKEISPLEVKGRVPEYVFNTQKDFFSCPQCRRIFWKGTHIEHMLKKIDRLQNKFKGSSS